MSFFHQTRQAAASALSRRTLLGGAAVGVTALAAGTGTAQAHTGGASHPSAPTPKAPKLPTAPTAKTQGFVTTHQGAFRLNGKPFRFGGTNCYYLHQQSHYMIDNALDDAAAMGLTVLRAWAFADGDGQSYRALQPKPYVYDEAAFDALDYAVWKAGQLGIRLVLPLVNNWPDYGGMQQYVQWFLGLPDDSYSDGTHHDRFYTEPKIKAAYKAYARFVIGRRNRYTGLHYNQDPTIMTFELANEPRCRSEKSGATLLGWAREMSAYVKKLAPSQLVAVGDEGFYGQAGNADYPYSDYEGTPWKKLVALPSVDYGTFHLYPQGWGENPESKPGTDATAWGTQWIKDHIADGRALRKPVVLEEFGVSVNAGQGFPDDAARLATYTAWTGAVRDNGGAGDQFWLLTSRVDDGSFYPDYDGYRITWNNDPANSTREIAQLFSAHAKSMASGG
ncbi:MULTISPECIES: glycoside hydrolase 5 family protein [unclassified Streptomyces]|uniref:glycoside hydrolase 5 family protein n=1 Tax=unclassified Streptomyces TaxID=2593676 RepID=UPI002E2A2994|nr:cellulase family glycosylhydrolase [Streptomyces sp. NBC_00223]